MSDNVIVQASHSAFRRAAIFMLAAAVSLCVFVWVGCRLPSAGSGGIILLSSPFEEGFVSGAVKLCIWEAVPLAVFSFASSYVFRTVFAAVVFSIRGAAIGASVMLCMENTANAAMLSIIISYAAVTLLIAAFSVILLQKDELCFMYRFLAYMTAVGAVAILRVFPYLLLK